MKSILTNISNSIDKKWSFVMLLTGMVTISNAQVCSSPNTTIYALSNAGAIYPVTLSTASVGSVVNTTSYGASTSANSIGYNNVNGSFYYFQDAVVGSPKVFVSYNPTTKVYTTLAASPITATVNRGCVNFNGTGYYCLDNSSNLYYYSISANTWTLITKTFVDQSNNNVTSTFTSLSSGDMAIDGYNDLWIVCSNGSNYGVYELAGPLPTAAQASITLERVIAPSSTTPGAGFTGVAFDPSGNLYLSTSNDLYKLQNLTTLTHIAAFSTAGVAGDLTSCSYPYSVLSVNWENFTVSNAENKSVMVSWQVSEQVNNKGYYVERSTDGMNWTQLGFVDNDGSADKDGASYSFDDNDPMSGNNYYRICEVDVDGKMSYSEIKMVKIAAVVSSLFNVWPNPATAVINIRTTAQGSAIARIYSLSGSLISESKIQAGASSINVSGLSYSVYIVSVSTADGQTFNKKFIKQ